MTLLCRDCFANVEGDTQPARRCAACGSPRIIQHRELAELSIAHIDCDAFYASIEKRDNPDLKDKPVIVGGGKRGVVMTACYVARTYGVHSAQPMFRALKLCPDAVVVQPNMAKYAAVGRQVRTAMLELTPLVEPLSLDEAFLDLSGTDRLHKHGAAETLSRLQTRIEREFGITVSIGLSYCKFLAKAGSDLDKPRGFSVIGRSDAMEFLSSRPVSLIWGVGKVFADMLVLDGLLTIGDIRKRDVKWLISRYGSIGLRLHELSNGIDNRPVDPAGERKSISSEVTLDEDVRDFSVLCKILWRQAERVSERAKASDMAGRTVVLKVKTAGFQIKTRNRRLPQPTQLADTLFRQGRAMLQPLADGTPYRLIGIGLADLVPGIDADQMDLGDPELTDRKGAESAMDKVRARFGKAAIIKGRSL